MLKFLKVIVLYYLSGGRFLRLDWTNNIHYNILFGKTEKSFDIEENPQIYQLSNPKDRESIIHLLDNIPKIVEKIK